MRAGALGAEHVEDVRRAAARDRLLEGDRAGAEVVRLDRDVRRAPRAVRDDRDLIQRLALELAHRADPPGQVREALRAEVVREGVELAEVGRRSRRLDLLVLAVREIPEERDLVGGGALDRRPAHHPGRRVRAVREARRRGRRLHLEAVLGAPVGHVAADVGAHACVERVRVAGAPRERQRHRGDRVRQVGLLPDDRVLGEVLARRDLELVGARALDVVPREGRRAREGVAGGLRIVRAQQESAQVGGRRRRRSDGGDRKEREDHSEGTQEHSLLLSAAGARPLSLKRGTGSAPRPVRKPEHGSRRRGVRSPRSRPEVRARRCRTGGRERASRVR